MKLIAGNSNRRLSEAISKRLATSLANADIKTFKDGEVFVEIQGFFDIPTDNLYAVKEFERRVREIHNGGLDEVTVISPDAGGVVRARALGKRLNDRPLAIVDKRRTSTDRQRRQKRLRLCNPWRSFRSRRSTVHEIGRIKPHDHH